MLNIVIAQYRKSCDFGKIVIYYISVFLKMKQKGGSCLDIICHIDHTLLKQTATWQQIQKICEEAIEQKTASVCIPPSYVNTCFFQQNNIFFYLFSIDKVWKIIIINVFKADTAAII